MATTTHSRVQVESVKVLNIGLGLSSGYTRGNTWGSVTMAHQSAMAPVGNGKFHKLSSPAFNASIIISLK